MTVGETRRIKRWIFGEVSGRSVATRGAVSRSPAVITVASCCQSSVPLPTDIAREMITIVVAESVRPASSTDVSGLSYTRFSPA